MSSDLPRSFGNFDRLTQFKLDATEIVVSKWRSRVTGLSLVHADYEGEYLLVQGYFAVNTEAFDNHALACSAALRLMVPTGSETYPYNGALNEIARRSFAQGINACSESDHTAYRVETAGSEGFLQILPVYVDHILHPTLTEAAFIAQVHHVNGKGEDAGILYSEVLDAESDARNMLENRRRQMELAADGDINDHSQTLRDVVCALTVEEGKLLRFCTQCMRVYALPVRQYHSTYYVPHNLCLIVAGFFAEGTSSLLRILQDQVEPSIISHGRGHSPFPPDWKRPSPRRPISLEKIEGVMKDTITVPEIDAGRGCLLVHLTTSPRGNPLEFAAFTVFYNYWLVFGDKLIDHEKKGMESYLPNGLELRRTSRASARGMVIYFDWVTAERLEVLDEVLLAPFNRMAEDGIDMGRMAKIINDTVRGEYSMLECRSRVDFYSGALQDFLFGPEDGSELEVALNLFRYYAVLKNWSSKEWMDHLKKYYIDAPRIVVRGKPSMDAIKYAEKAEIGRLVTQVQKLGPEGLKRAARRLKEATEEMEEPVPGAVLIAFPIPNVNHLRWKTLRTVQEPGIGRHATVEDADPTIQAHLAFDGEELPFFVQYDHVQSFFTTVSAVLTLNKVPDRLRPYLYIYTQVFYSLPIKKRTGVCLSSEETVARLSAETVSAVCGFGETDTLCIDIKVELSHYETAVSWLRDLMYGTEFTREALQNAIATYHNAYRPARTVSDVLNAGTQELVYPNNSIARALGPKMELSLIRALRTQIEEHPSVVIAAFEEIRRCLTLPSSVRFSVKGDILSIEQPRSVWARHFGDVLPTSDLDPVLQRSSLDEIGKKAVLIPTIPNEEIHARFTTKGPQRVDDPSTPALDLITRMLNAKDGYLQRYVGNHGHASVQSGAGLVSLNLSGCSPLAQVFEAAANAIKGLADGSLEIDNAALETAKSTVVHSTVLNLCELSDAESRASVTENSFIDQVLHGTPKDWRKTFVGRIQDATREDVLKALRAYYLPLFDPEKSVAVVSWSTDVEQMLVARGYEIIDDDDGKENSEDDSEDDREDDSEVSSEVDSEVNGEVDTDVHSEVNSEVNREVNSRNVGEVNREVNGRDVGEVNMEDASEADGEVDSG